MKAAKNTCVVVDGKIIPWEGEEALRRCKEAWSRSNKEEGPKDKKAKGSSQN